MHEYCMIFFETDKHIEHIEHIVFSIFLGLKILKIMCSMCLCVSKKRHTKSKKNLKKI